MDRQLSQMDGKVRRVEPGKDRLETMLIRQKRFATGFFNTKAMGPAEREEWIKEMCLADIVETVELLNETRWKHWKKGGKPMDAEAARFEVADKLCFLLNIADLLEMNAESLFQHHQRKLDINEKRQKEGY